MPCHYPGGMDSTLLLLVFLLAAAGAEAVNQDGLHLLEAKRLLTNSGGSALLADWNPRDATPCKWSGISCDDGDGLVTAISLPDANLTGSFPAAALCRLPRLRSINLYMNYIGPELSFAGIGVCRWSLQHLDLSMNTLVGPLPADLADHLPELVYLDLSSNNFTGPIPESLFGRGGFRRLESLSLVYNLLEGEIPASLGSLPALRELNLSYNPFSSPSGKGNRIPPELGNLSSLRVLWLAGCNLVGPIPPTLGRLANLTDLDLSTNSLTGRIPPEIAAGLTSAVQIELYNNSLSGPIPHGFGGLKHLRHLDISMNNPGLGGAIPEDLFRAPSLETVHLYANNLTGPLPAESLANSTSLVELRLFGNRIDGALPAGFGANAPLVCVDLSDNLISGEIPASVCDRGELEELLLLDNHLSGPIPESLGRCRSLRRVRLANNRLTGDVPKSVWGLPHMSLLELNDNDLTGGISPAIAGAANLSKLVLSNNRLSGSIPSEIGSASKLYDISADGNMLSGPLPASLAGLPDLGRLVLRNNSLSGQLLRGIRIQWRKLSELNLADNKFSGSIPAELGDLPVLNYLDLSGNRLTGQVPAELENLKLNQFNVSNNQLSGPLPPQYAANPEAYRNSFLGNPELCREIPSLLCSSSSSERQKSSNKSSNGFAWMIFVFAGVVLVAGIAWFYWRYLLSHRKKKKSKLMDRSKWTLTSFHKLPFSEYEILDCLEDEDNVIGRGASGKVYKAVLSNGEVVAVKKLFLGRGTGAARGHGGMMKQQQQQSEEEEESTMERGHGNDESTRSSSFDAEVRTLGKIRHKNIVKLWCCCAHREHKLLVYEYMPNGSLADVLHNSTKAGLLDWPTRYRIALDAAEGLSYLHHDCVPAIVHRDVKSSNILLDAQFGARVADFGVAKVVDGRAGAAPPKSMSVIAGSCGYIAPEYAYTLRVNEKSDTYSFGVVLLELVTGKPPVDHPDFGDRDLVKWVCNSMDLQKLGGEGGVVDSRLDMSLYGEEITRVLHIALVCASSLPINRPAMRTVVKMLQQARDLTLTRTTQSQSRQQGLLVLDTSTTTKLSPYYYYEDTTTSSDQG